MGSARLCAFGGLMIFSALSVTGVRAAPGADGAECQVPLPCPLDPDTDGWASSRHGAVGAVPERTRRTWPDEPSAREQPPGNQSSLAPRRRRYFSVMGYHMLILQRGHQPKLNAGVAHLRIAGPFGPRLSGRASPWFDIQDGGADVGQAWVHSNTRRPAQFGSGRFGRLIPFAIFSNQGGPQMSMTQPLVLATAADTGTAWTPGSPLRGLELGFVARPGWSVYLGAGEARLEGGNTTTRSMRLYATPEWKRWHAGNLASGNRQTGLYASADYLWGPSGNSVTLYGYWGRATLPVSAARGGLHRVGAFANFYLPQTKMVAGYLTGKDTAAGGRSLEMPGFFMLAERLLTDRWAVYGRYDGLRRGLDAGGSQQITGPTLGVSWWVQTQMRLTLEGQVLNTSAQPQDRRLVTGLFWNF